MTEFKYKGREKEWEKEYRINNKKILAEKMREYGKLNPWYLEKKIINEKLRTGKINKVEHHAEMNRIDKERMKNKRENFKKNRRNIIKEIKSSLDENEQIRNKEIKIIEKQNEINQGENAVLLETLDEENKKIKELKKKNETLWTDLRVVIARFRKQNIELMNLKEELAILKIDNEELERKLRVIDDRDKPDIDNMINTPSIFGRKQTTIVSKLKKRMDEMHLEKEKASAGNISPADD